MTSTADADWSVIENPEVIELIHKAARKVGVDYASVCEEDDARQEAFILCAGRAERIRDQLANGQRGHVYHELHCDLVDLYKRQADKAHQTIHIERLLELDGEDDE